MTYSRSRLLSGIIAVAVVFGFSAPCAYAEEDLDSVAEALLAAVGAETKKCAEEDVEIGFARRCGRFAGDLRKFEKSWDAMLVDHQDPVALTPKGKWNRSRFGDYSSRSYKLNGGSLRVQYSVFHPEAPGSVELHYDKPQPQEPLSAEGPLIAGIGNVSNPLLIPESKINPVSSPSR